MCEAPQAICRTGTMLKACVEAFMACCEVAYQCRAFVLLYRLSEVAYQCSALLERRKKLDLNPGYREAFLSQFKPKTDFFNNYSEIETIRS